MDTQFDLSQLDFTDPLTLAATLGIALTLGALGAVLGAALRVLFRRRPRTDAVPMLRHTATEHVNVSVTQAMPVKVAPAQSSKNATLPYKPRVSVSPDSLRLATTSSNLAAASNRAPTALAPVPPASPAAPAPATAPAYVVPRTDIHVSTARSESVPAAGPGAAIAGFLLLCLAARGLGCALAHREEDHRRKGS